VLQNPRLLPKPTDPTRPDNLTQESRFRNPSRLSLRFRYNPAPRAGVSTKSKSFNAQRDDDCQSNKPQSDKQSESHELLSSAVHFVRTRLGASSDLACPGLNWNSESAKKEKKKKIQMITLAGFPKHSCRNGRHLYILYQSHNGLVSTRTYSRHYKCTAENSESQDSMT